MADLWLTDEYVAGMPGVNAGVLSAAKEFKAKWVSAMGAHTQSGDFARSIKVMKANSKDYWVYAAVRYGVWAEYGHEGWTYSVREGGMVYFGPVRGIHVLRSLL